MRLTELARRFVKSIFFYWPGDRRIMIMHGGGGGCLTGPRAYRVRYWERTGSRISGQIAHIEGVGVGPVRSADP